MRFKNLKLGRWRKDIVVWYDGTERYLNGVGKDSKNGFEREVEEILRIEIPTCNAKSFAKFAMFIRVHLRNNNLILSMHKRIRKLFINRRQSLTMTTPTNQIHHHITRQDKAKKHVFPTCDQEHWCKTMAGRDTYQGAKNSTRAGFPESTISSKLAGVRSITLLANARVVRRPREKRTDERVRIVVACRGNCEEC